MKEKIEPARIHVRFSDLDVFGHVNNAVYLSYFEIARVHYFGKILGLNWDWRRDGVLLVHNEVEYIKPVLLKDQPYITLFSERIGTKSFTLYYELHVEGELRTKGRSTLVCFDSSKNATILIPPAMKAGLEQLESRPLEKKE